MKITKKFLFMTLAILGIMIVGSGLKSYASETTDIFLKILEGNVTIGSTASIDLGNLNVSSSEQTKEGTFSENFWVEDLKGADKGWYTTLQASDMINQSDPSIKIPATNISMKAPTTITKIAGNDNSKVVIESAWASYRQINTVLTFINREEDTNNGVLGKYGVMPSIKVTVPAYQSVGTYKSILTYTLIEN